jgi:hypothetical protein
MAVTARGTRLRSAVNGNEDEEKAEHREREHGALLQRRAQQLIYRAVFRAGAPAAFARAPSQDALRVEVRI